MSYWFFIGLLIALNLVSLMSNLFLLPGNWFMTGLLCIFLVLSDFSHGPTWIIVLVCVVLAGLGEVLELAMGSARAAKKGASRRAMLISMGLSFLCSIIGTFVVPIPIVGSVIGAILGAGIGAFAGAWLGEAWKGTDPALRSEIGNAAMVGRLLGMVAKGVVGVAIFVVQLVSFWL
ncbi:MAG: DUF456 domain-containing protein [Planctomycetota bacterium]|nr:DUF456 domain-containing protein [Planctomycetota bacterium]